MDLRLREIAGQPAGTYFIVNDNSTQSDVVSTSNLRVVFVNTELGNPNVAVMFQRGDIAGFNSVFGKQSRKKEKQGNFSIPTVERMLESGPVVVINLREFDDSLDTIQVSGISTNQTLSETKVAPFSKVFNQNGFWTFKGKELPKFLTSEHLLNFANIGKGAISYFVTPAASISQLTSEGEESLVSTSLEIEEYPALTEDLKVKDTFVDVWIFKNDLASDSATNNQYYGQLFNETGLINQESLEELSLIPEAGFIRKITGSVIPYLKSENDEDLSIDVLINQYYLQTGLACYLNDDILEFEEVNDSPVINTTAVGYYTPTGTLVDSGNLLSYRLQPLTVPTLNIDDENVDLTNHSKTPLIKVSGNIFPGAEKNKVYAIFENGIRVGDTIVHGTDFELETTVTKIEVEREVQLNSLPNVTSLAVAQNMNQLTFSIPTTIADTLPVGYSTKVYINGEFSASAVIADYTVTTNRVMFEISAEGYATKTTVTAKVYSNGTETPVVEYDNTIKEGVKSWKKVIMTTNLPIVGEVYYRKARLQNIPDLKLKPTTIQSYVPREEQFTNGSSIRQNEILDVMNSPSITKGIKNFVGIRYFVDAFKSFVEPNYKYQFGLLTKELQEKCNKFVNAFINEPFIEDLEESTNPLFKTQPGGVLDLGAYLADGGNKDYSTTLLTKFSSGAEYCYFFGIGDVVRSITYPGAANVANLFADKTFPWDVVANETGFLDGITSLEINPDDSERKAMEDFRWNPVIVRNDGYTIYGNLTGQRTKSALQEIHNAELLSYIKESLYNMSQSENFKKGTYNEYLAFQTEVQSFMDNLAQNGAIQPNPVVQCDLVNNTSEVQSYKIKLVRVEYGNITALDKVVFELNLN